ncbi:putative DnaJ like protein subfamily C member 21 [Phyllosticta citribraziliensis]|uniref:DnaJ like protein subfamily C member 21 n=1 Tax=Phyllosticta citribraziliensis TaxID=989973 RepID=A0ABR1L831_9PEZI
MGAGQSSASGGASSQTTDAAVKTSYYELLGIERQATEEEIRKAYRRKALELHPDRNYGREEWATELFAEIQSAYQVLSDPQERAWYDSHESAILRGADPADEHFEHDVKVTTADDIARMMKKFNSRVEYSDESTGFFGYLREVFETLAKEERVAASWDGLDVVDYPGFGGEHDDYDDAVKNFYAVWGSFSTKKSFSWMDKYRYSDAPDRRTRRFLEKENARFREEGIREFNDAVRQLVAFVRKRDPRYLPNTQTETERQQMLRDMRAAQAARARAAHEAKMNEEVPEWTKTREPEELEEEEEEEIVEEHFECVACNKTFKSEKQWEAHEKSKKHQKAVYALQKKMRKENKNLHLDDEVPSSGMATPDDAEEDWAEEPRTPDDVEDAAEAIQNTTLENDSLSDADEKMNRGQPTKRPSQPSPADPLDNASDSDQSSSNSDYVPRSKLESRLAGTSAEPPLEEQPHSQQPSAEVDLEEDDEDNTAFKQSQPKIGKAAQKRAKKAAKLAEAEAEELKHKCAVCSEAFSSKTQLFRHVRDEGHAAPVPQAGKGAGGGKKKGKK